MENFRDGVLHSGLEELFNLSKIPEQNFSSYLLRRANEFLSEGRRICLKDAKNNVDYEYGDIHRMSRMAANFFFTKGLKKNDVVIYTSHDCGLLYFLAIGVWRAQGVLRAVYSEEMPETVISKLEESKSHFLICDPEMALKISSKNFPWPIEVIVIGNSVQGFTNASKIFTGEYELGKFNLIEEESGGDDPALILSTSGTTGLSKGALLTHRNLIANALAWEILPVSLDKNSPILWFGKPTHVSGFQYTLSVIASGFYIIRSEYNGPENMIQKLQHYKPSAMMLVTPLLAPIVEPKHEKDDLSFLRNIICGAAIMPEYLSEGLRKRLPWATITHNTEKTLIGNGWLATGDLGYFDQNGFIFILDRVKDTFLCQIGNHISPSELENVIMSHELVLEACVVPHPFEQVGDPRGFVVLKNKHLINGQKEKDIAEEIKKFVNDQLAEYKHLHGGVFIIPELPRGKTGKITRRFLANYNCEY